MTAVSRSAARPDTVPATSGYDVGGVRLPRPFKIRRLGHFGYNCRNIDAMLDFYVGGLGLIISDQSGTMPSRLPAEEQASLSPNEKLLHFMRFGSDHHQLVLISQPVWDWVGQANGSAGASINQITWQVGSLAEVVNGDAWVADQDQHLLRSGRDMPGSNWHTYLFDPEGHINELYYGMEQIGWDGLSQPRQMWSGVLTERPGLPQPAEATEVENALGTGIGIASGHRPVTASSPSYPVNGCHDDTTVQDRRDRPGQPFRCGPRAGHAVLPGHTRLHRTDFGGVERAPRGHAQRVHRPPQPCPVRARSPQCAAAVRSARFAGARVPARQLPPAAGRGGAHARPGRRGSHRTSRPAPGLHYVTHLRDPDGNLVQLYYYQQQCAPTGPTPPTVSEPAASWPDLVDAPADVFAGQQFLGPWE